MIGSDPERKRNREKETEEERESEGVGRNRGLMKTTCSPQPTVWNACWRKAQHFVMSSRTITVKSLAIGRLWRLSRNQGSACVMKSSALTPTDRNGPDSHPSYSPAPPSPHHSTLAPSLPCRKTEFGNAESGSKVKNCTH